jgi:hypothetical protein
VKVTILVSEELLWLISMPMWSWSQPLLLFLLKHFSVTLSLALLLRRLGSSLQDTLPLSPKDLNKIEFSAHTANIVGVVLFARIRRKQQNLEFKYLLTSVADPDP